MVTGSRRGAGRLSRGACSERCRGVSCTACGLGLFDLDWLAVGVEEVERVAIVAHHFELAIDGEVGAFDDIECGDHTEGAFRRTATGETQRPGLVQADVVAAVERADQRRRDGLRIGKIGAVKTGKQSVRGAPGFAAVGIIATSSMSPASKEMLRVIV